jgi:hypothetical protein
MGRKIRAVILRIPGRYGWTGRRVRRIVQALLDVS